MHTSVRNYFVRFNKPIEGWVSHMYLDIKGLVTIGMGNLIDVESGSVEKILTEVKKLPFVHKTAPGVKSPGQKASPTDIETEWKLVKSKQKLAKDGHLAFAKLDITKLELTDPEINKLVMTKLDTMERELKTDPAFQKFDHWPADAQLGLLSMAWAMGATRLRTGWPNFKAACQKQDFDDAAQRCGIITAGNLGVNPRNDADQRLFKNAAAVLANGGSNPAQNQALRMTLYYPGMMMKPVVIRG